jgi:MTH538 TIR-like domain (DUF1863)
MQAHRPRGALSAPRREEADLNMLRPIHGLFAAIGAAVVGFLYSQGWRDDKNARPPSEAPITPRAFISFDFDHDQQIRHLFAGQCRKNSPTPFSAQDWSSKEALPQRQWEDLISAKIEQCHFMFVLVSPTAHRAHGIAKEISMATKHRVPMIGVYIAGADETTPLPAGLSRADAVAWEWKSIAATVRRALTQGKNAR